MFTKLLNSFRSSENFYSAIFLITELFEAFQDMLLYIKLDLTFDMSY